MLILKLVKIKKNNNEIFIIHGRSAENGISDNNALVCMYTRSLLLNIFSEWFCIKLKHITVGAICSNPHK